VSINFVLSRYVFKILPLVRADGLLLLALIPLLCTADKDVLKGQRSVSSFFKTPSPAAQTETGPPAVRQPSMTGKKEAKKPEVVDVDAEEPCLAAAVAPAAEKAPAQPQQSTDDMAVDKPVAAAAAAPPSAAKPAASSQATGSSSPPVSNTRLDGSHQRGHNRRQHPVPPSFDLSAETPRKTADSSSTTAAGAAPEQEAAAEADDVVMSEPADDDAADAEHDAEASGDSTQPEPAAAAATANDAAAAATPLPAKDSSAAPMEVVEISDELSASALESTPTLASAVAAAAAAVAPAAAGKGKGRGKARASSAGRGAGAGSKGKGKAAKASAAAAAAGGEAAAEESTASAASASASAIPPPPPHPLLGRYTEQLQCLLTELGATAEEDEPDHHAGIQEALADLTEQQAAAAASGTASDATAEADAGATGDIKPVDGEAAAATAEPAAETESTTESTTADAPAVAATLAAAVEQPALAAAAASLAPSAAFPDELSPLLARLIQGSRSPLPPLAAATAAALCSLVPPAAPALIDIAVLTPELVAEKIVAIAARKAYGAAPRRSVLRTDETPAALWRWEVESAELLLCGGEAAVKGIRAERGSAGRHVKALVKLIEVLTKHPADVAKVSGRSLQFAQ
jgi:hypothetical protein